METRLAREIVKEAAKQDIPLVGDVIQSQHGPTVIQIMHYDFGTDLSLFEKLVIDGIVATAAKRLGVQSHFTLNALSYSASENPN